MKSKLTRFWMLMALMALPQSLSAQILKQNVPYLVSVFPASGGQGTEVTIEFRGIGVMKGENRVLVEGPPGIDVTNVEFVRAGLLKATLRIDADAPPGRRLLRVHNLQEGATNYRYFFVSPLPVATESESNDSPETAEEVKTPLLINARINKTLDTDWFRFQATAGQNIVAAVTAHGMDCFTDYSGKQKGFLDTNLTLRNASGAVLATSEDALGLDPLIEFQVPADGEYSIQVQSLNYAGSDYATYLLTLGEVPFVTGFFPAGGERGKTTTVAISGPNIPAGSKAEVAIPGDGTNPVCWTSFPQSSLGIFALPLMRGDHPEFNELEPNDSLDSATAVTVPVTVNGRFFEQGDVDWYRLSLKKGASVLLRTTAQRYLRSPVDTELSLYDASGKKLATNDDGAAFGAQLQAAHDFASSDSWLTFRAQADGEYFVRVRDLNGTAGQRSVYRLQIESLLPDFQLDQWPDAVPIWGPGTSAAFVVEVLRWGGLKEDIVVSVEGLPAGWSGGTTVWPKSWYPHYQGNAPMRLLVTITAPADAEVGSVVPFRVVGRSTQEGREIVHDARTMTLYGSSHNDRMHLRHSDGARAFVADYRDAWVETDVKQLEGVEGTTIEIPVKVHRPEGKTDPIGLVINGPTPSAGCGWSSPLLVKEKSADVKVPLTLQGRPPGLYSIMVSRSWASDIRAGRPGPCTSTILLKILPKSAGK